MYKHNGTQYMYRHEIEGFMNDINFRSVITDEEWYKFKEEKIDRAVFSKEVNIEYVVTDLDYGTDGAMVNNGKINTENFNGAKVEIFTDVRMVEKDDTEARMGFRCYPPSSYDDCKKWVGKQIFIIDKELVEIPRNSVIVRAKLYVKGVNETYKRQLEEKQRKERINEYFDELHAKLDMLPTPWIMESINERGDAKQKVSFEFMGNEVFVYCKDKMSAIIVSNYLFELDANRLFQGKLDFPNLRFTNIEKKLGTSLEEYCKMRQMLSLDPIYSLVKDRINFVIQHEGLENLISKELKEFLKVDFAKNGEILDRRIADLLKISSK